MDITTDTVKNQDQTPYLRSKNPISTSKQKLKPSKHQTPCKYNNPYTKPLSYPQEKTESKPKNRQKPKKLENQEIKNLDVLIFGDVLIFEQNHL